MAHHFDDDFEEDGGTFDFFDESGFASGSVVPSGMVYREYHGEDFAQYLNDDDDHHPTGFPVESNWQLDNPGRPEDGSYSKRRRPKSTAIIREKLGRLLLSGGSGRSPMNSLPPPPQNLSSIYDVSFADCKMGSMLMESPRAPGSDSGIDTRSGFSLETESDLGAQASSGWWDADAARRQVPRSTSSDLYECARSGTETPPDRTEMRQGSHADVPRSQRRGSGPERATPEGGNRLSNTFRKIYNTLNRRKGQQNLQQMSYSQDYEDLRF